MAKVAVYMNFILGTANSLEAFKTTFDSINSLDSTHRNSHVYIGTVHSPKNALFIKLGRFKIYTKIHTKYRPYMFRYTTIIRELVLNLAKVIFILKYSVKLRRYMLFGDVAACCINK
jgi:hypothetical protein